MSEPKWTPGPWRRNPKCNAVVADAATGFEDRENIEYYGGHLIAESIFRYENADLIAAAPDLYQALEALVLAEEAAGSDGLEAERRRAAIAALRKARGET